MSASLARFARACRKWQARFGLTDWNLQVKVKGRDEAHYAYVEYDNDSRHAAITYVEGNNASIEDSALHEVLHVLLADLLATAARRGSDTHDDVRREEHRLIERLLPLLRDKK